MRRRKLCILNVQEHTTVIDRHIGSMSYHGRSELTIDTIFVLHYICVMKNVTITLEEEIARWARVHAAERDMSLSRFVAELLKEKMGEEKNYQAAMQHYLEQPPRTLKTPGDTYPPREELHER